VVADKENLLFSLASEGSNWAQGIKKSRIVLDPMNNISNVVHESVILPPFSLYLTMHASINACPLSIYKFSPSFQYLHHPPNNYLRFR